MNENHNYTIKQCPYCEDVFEYNSTFVTIDGDESSNKNSSGGVGIYQDHRIWRYCPICGGRLGYFEDVNKETLRKIAQQYRNMTFMKTENKK